jgi:hypothetical protein
MQKSIFSHQPSHDIHQKISIKRGCFSPFFLYTAVDSYREETGIRVRLGG